MFKEYVQGQAQLLPPDINDLISPDHLARLVNQVVDKMDLGFIEQTYSPDGCRAYHPRMLVKVLIYGYAIGIRSSRKLSDRLQEDIAFMWLSGRQTPDFRTISDFRQHKLQDIKTIFVQVLATCRELGMIRIGKVSIDGTKLQADSGKNRMIYRKVLAERNRHIASQVEQILNEAIELDQEEEQIYGNRTEHQTGLTEKEIARRLGKVKRRQETLKRHKNKLTAKKQANKHKLRIMRKDRNSMGATDPDATMMQMKERYIAPGYNVQLASEQQVILAYGLSSDRNDQHQLKPMARAVQNNTGVKPKIALADAGYGSKRNYRFLKQQKIVAFMPYNNLSQDLMLKRKGLYQPPDRPDIELETYKARQRIRALSSEGKIMAKRRRQDIEPVIGDIKRNMGFRRFNLRGKPKCLIEIGLTCLGHNLKKIKSYTKNIIESQSNENEKVIDLGRVLGYLPRIT